MIPTPPIIPFSRIAPRIQKFSIARTSSLIGAMFSFWAFTAAAQSSYPSPSPSLSPEEALEKECAGATFVGKLLVDNAACLKLKKDSETTFHQTDTMVDGDFTSDHTTTSKYNVTWDASVTTSLKDETIQSTGGHTLSDGKSEINLATGSYDGNATWVRDGITEKCHEKRLFADSRFTLSDPTGCAIPAGTVGGYSLLPSSVTISETYPSYQTFDDRGRLFDVTHDFTQKETSTSELTVLVSRPQGGCVAVWANYWDTPIKNEDHAVRDTVEVQRERYYPPGRYSWRYSGTSKFSPGRINWELVWMNNYPEEKKDKKGRITYYCSHVREPNPDTTTK